MVYILFIQTHIPVRVDSHHSADHATVTPRSRHDRALLKSQSIHTTRHAQDPVTINPVSTTTQNKLK